MSNTALAEHEAVKRAAAPAEFDKPPQSVAHAFDRSSYVLDEHRRGPRIRRATDPSKARALVTPRDKEPWVALRAANVKALGPRGAIVFDYIAQWYEPKKNGAAHLRVKDCFGGFWHACSFTEIEERTGLEKYDAERGITACVDAGVLETTVMKFGGHRTLHIRIAEANGAATLQGPLIVGPVDGAKLAGPFKNDSKVDGSTLITDQSGPVNFPIQHQLPSTPIKTTPAATSLAASSGSPEASQGEAKPGCAEAVKSGESSEKKKTSKATHDGFHEAAPKLRLVRDYIRGVESIGAKAFPECREVYRNVNTAKAKLMAAGLDYEQVSRFFFLLGAESDVLEMHLHSSKSSPDAKKHSRPEGVSMLAWVVGTPKMNCNMVLLALEVLYPRLGVQKPASETPPDAEKEALWAAVKAKKAAEQAERDAEREAARQAKLAAAASKARRDARAQRLGFADFKSLHRELYLRRCAKVEAKHAKPAPALASAPTTPPVALACHGTSHAPVQTATAPVITFTSDPITWLEEIRYVGRLREQREAATMEIIRSNGWPKLKPVAVAA